MIISRVRTVVEEVQDNLKEISLPEAKKLDNTANMGDELSETLPL